MAWKFPKPIPIFIPWSHTLAGPLGGPAPEPPPATYLKIGWFDTDNLYEVPGTPGEGQEIRYAEPYGPTLQSGRIVLVDDGTTEFVQATHDYSQTSPAEATYDSDVTAGNLLLAYVEGSPDSLNISDNMDNDWVKIASALDQPLETVEYSLWAAVANSSGPLTVTASATTFVLLGLSEYTGASTPPFDVSTNEGEGEETAFSGNLNPGPTQLSIVSSDDLFPAFDYLAAAGSFQLA